MKDVQLPEMVETWDLVNCQHDPRLCSGETACHDLFKNGSQFCVCYHSARPPIHGICPRNTVQEFRVSSVHNLTADEFKGPKSLGIPIQVGIVGTGKSGHSMSPMSSVPRSMSSPGVSHVTVLVTLVTLALFLLLMSTLLYFKRKTFAKIFKFGTRQQKISGEKDGGVVPGRLFPLDSFVLNPTYEASPLLDLTVPVFSASEIKIIKQIGQGCFGKVFKGELSGELVAVKVAKREHSGEALKEVETMAAFNHANILRLIGIATNQGDEPPWLLFEFMDYGDLATLLRTLSPERITAGKTSFQDEDRDSLDLPELSTNDLLDIASQIAEGMSYLCSQHFVHRDLAARNCLVGRNGRVKVSDFGLTRDVYTCDYYKIGGSRLLPVRWMSPESVLYGRFTLESDVWAYGVLLWEIYTWGKQPYYGHSNEEVVQLILDGVLLAPPSSCPPFICGLMAGCWKSDPKDRLRFPLVRERFLARNKEIRLGMEEDGNYERPNRKPREEYMEVV